jgi:HD superfamily phosphohydrolase
MATALDGVANSICERFLAPYVERIRANGFTRLGAKQIHDQVWGTISLRPLEVALIDSPLLQRLRHLRQLGVAHWVYPGADHCRFEHSLGVLFQTQQLISAINRAGNTKYSQTVISDDDVQMLRVAALMHDVGHPVLSHVSEYALRLDPNILLEVQRERKAVGEKVTVSELVAAKIVRSTHFKDLLDVIAVEHGKAKLPSTNWISDPTAFAERVAKTILGQNVSSTIPLLHEIVSGPYDADKLDYMVRDPKAAGLPATIDISRLVQKLSVTRMSSRDLPESIARLVPQETRESYLFGFPWSGLSVIDELLLGRVMLYAKLYRHPKVASLEAIVQTLLHQLDIVSGPQAVVAFIYDVLDDQLVLADEKELLHRLSLTSSDLQDSSKANAIEVATDLLRRLRERELFVRAFAFFPGQTDGTGGERESNVFDRIIKHIDDSSKGEELRLAIVEETKRILELLSHDETDFLFRNLNEMVVIRRLPPPSQKELRHAWIFPNGGAPRTFEKTSIHKEAWSSSFVSASAKGYIYCPKELAKSVLIASESVIACQFGVRIPEWMLEETKYSPASLRDVKLSLRQKNFYKGKPRIIRPRWPRLDMNDVENIVSSFAERFGAVQEAVTKALEAEEHHNSVSDLKERAYTWLDQFNDEGDIECGLQLLKCSRLIARQDVVGAVRAFLDDHPDFSGASVISLSKGNDSSQIIQYFAADVGGSLHFHGSLAEAAHANRDAPILIVDDFCGSGNQWANLIGSLFGDSDLQHPDLNEQRSLALEPERDYLRGQKVGFIFTAGWRDGAGVVLQAAQKVSIRADVYIHLTEDVLPFASNVLEDESVVEFAAGFLERAGAIGKALLQQNEPDWPPDKTESRKLGYGNRGMLLFFPYNAPSQTLTCMWAAGEVDGEEWEPILRRRKKI